MISTNPLIGASRKSLANVTASKSFKKNIWRSKPQGQRKNSTTNQINQNTFFKSSSLFVTQFKEILKIGYRDRQINMPLRPWLIGHFMKIAPDTLTPHQSILRINCNISEGTQQPPPEVCVFTWNNQSWQIGWTALDPEDPLYFPKKLHVAYCKNDGTLPHYVLNIPIPSEISTWTSPEFQYLPGDIIYVWLIWENLLNGNLTQMAHPFTMEIDEA